MKFVVNLALLTSTIVSMPVNAKVIYGEDGRKDVFEAKEALQELARSTAVMMGIEHIRPSQVEGTIDLNQTSFEDWLEAQSDPESDDPRQLFSRSKYKTELISETGIFKLTFCAGERFTQQPNPGWCSGFLIAPDLIVTAGHCAKKADACANYRWIFDFKVDEKSGMAGNSIPFNNVYTCKRVVTSALDQGTGADYAVIQLDKKVIGREPLEVNPSGKVALDAELLVIGNPSGLPTKVTEGGKVRTSTERGFFTAVLDTYQGNSGSAVFNAETKLVEGILVSGENDFNFNETKGCIESQHCKEDECDGEGVSRITSIPELALLDIVNTFAVEGNTSMLNKIFDYNLYVDFYLKDGQSALIKAAAVGMNSSLVVLLAHGADANLSDADGNTALHHLAKILSPANSEALATLITAGAKLDVENNIGLTPLMMARSVENIEGEKLFLQAGATK